MARTHHNLISVKANLERKLSPPVFRCAGGRNQNQKVRFWIISMMLVLVGLSTLKLR
jgi:UDP-N-acetylmuramyl pentapeptide phosphotransferase/UDP-N-acetylglucosamine-1-phosphate transferase